MFVLLPKSDQWTLPYSRLPTPPLAFSTLAAMVNTKVQTSVEETTKDVAARVDARQWIHLPLYDLVPGIGPGLTSWTSIQAEQYRVKAGTDQEHRLQSKDTTCFTATAQDPLQRHP